MRNRIIIAAIVAALVVAPAISQDVRNTYVGVTAQIADNIVTIAKLNGLGSNVSTALATNTNASGGITTPNGTATLTNKTIDGTANTVSQVIGSKVISSTRDLTAANGAVAYTGIGFRPRAIIAFGTVNGGSIVANINYISIADSSATTAAMASSSSTTSTIGGGANGTIFAFFDTTGTAFQLATLTSIDSDGFTLTWAKTGSPTGTATLKFLCLQ